MGNFDDLMQSGFWVIPKVTFANLSKPVSKVTIIPVSSDPLNLEAVEGKGKKTKKWTLWEQRELFRWSEKHFLWFLKYFLLGKKKKNRRHKF